MAYILFQPLLYPFIVLPCEAAVEVNLVMLP